MPSRAPSICAHPGCSTLTAGVRCLEHMNDRHRRTDENRLTSAQRGYDARWQKARASFLSRNPLCVACMGDGKVRPANVVDHITPHRGDYELFWDANNWQALCTTCHNRKTAGGH